MTNSDATVLRVGHVTVKILVSSSPTMDRQDSNRKYHIASGSSYPANPESPGHPTPFPRAPQDQRLPRLHTSMHPSSPPPPPPKPYPNNQFKGMPVPSSLTPGWLPPSPDPQTQAGYFNYGYPTHPANGSQMPGNWPFPEPQIMRSVSQKASLHPPTAPIRPRAHSSTGMHPRLETSTSSPNLKHKYSHSDSHGAMEWYMGDNVNDGFEVSELNASVRPTQTRLNEFCFGHYVGAM